jgi:rare lipoprotein A (peptidoglycan hydrolase)
LPETSESPIRATVVADVRPRNVVASVALIAQLVTVAVPGPVGSRGPSPIATVDPGLFQRVEVAALARGTVMTIQPQDPRFRSAGALDRTTALVDTALRAEPPRAPVRPAQRTPVAGSISKDTWRHDGDISWYGPHLYGHRTACGQALTKTLVGVAHRTLPCGTLVTFRYNGVTMNVPVIDRGPYVSGRTWDLSNGACRRLNHCFTGSIDWKLAGA